MAIYMTVMAAALKLVGELSPRRRAFTLSRSVLREELWPVESPLLLVCYYDAIQVGGATIPLKGSDSRAVKDCALAFRRTIQARQSMQWRTRVAL